MGVRLCECGCASGCVDVWDLVRERVGWAGWGGVVGVGVWHLSYVFVVRAS